MNRQTFQANAANTTAQWWHVDATDLVLGRISTKLATVLMGKHKPQYTPHCDTGDFIVVTNAEKVKLTGDKIDQKLFVHFTGYPGGRKTYTYRWMLENHPDQLLEWSVRRMLPKSKLGRHMLGKLKIYAGSEHPHQAQQPKPLT